MRCLSSRFFRFRNVDQISLGSKTPGVGLAVPVVYDYGIVYSCRCSWCPIGFCIRVCPIPRCALHLLDFNRHFYHAMQHIPSQLRREWYSDARGDSFRLMQISDNYKQRLRCQAGSLHSLKLSSFRKVWKHPEVTIELVQERPP